MEGLPRCLPIANQVDTRLSNGLGLVCHVNALLVRCGTVQVDRAGRPFRKQQTVDVCVSLGSSSEMPRKTSARRPFNYSAEFI
jgi:hypothetical protein